MRSSKNILFCIIENEGGMSDVSKSYLDFFEGTRSDNALLILSEKPERSVSDLNRLKRKNIYYLYFENLFFLNPSRVKKFEPVIQRILSQKEIDLVVCDYIGYRFFKYENVKIVADIHYLMATSNKVGSKTPDSEYENRFRFLNKKLDEIMFRRSLLIKQKVEKDLLNRAEAILVNSASTRQDVLREYGYLNLRPRILVSPVGKCLTGIIPKLNSRSKKIIFHGRINSIKGVQFLPQIAEKLKVPVCIVGVNRHTSKIFDAKMKKEIRLFDWTFSEKMLNKHLSMGIFHIFPSFYEPWGLALTKSMAMGAICIANTQGGGHFEQITNGRTGFLVNIGAPGFELEIEQIVNLPASKLTQISRNARKAGKELMGKKHEYVRRNIALINAIMSGING